MRGLRYEKGGRLFYAPIFLILSFLALISIRPLEYGEEIKVEGEELSEMVYIPGGKFILKRDNECVVRIIEDLQGEKVNLKYKKINRVKYVKGFYINRYEVTNAQYKKFVDGTGHSAPPHWDGLTPPKGEENYPIININWYDAQAFCEWAGKQLPTEEEWEKAAIGTDGRRYPWGNDFYKGFTNTWESGIKKVRSVNQNEQDKSPFGVYDMAGNVMEWTSTWERSLRIVIKGGSWATDGSEYSMQSKVLAKPSMLNNAVGFRCAKSPSIIKRFFHFLKRL